MNSKPAVSVQDADPAQASACGRATKHSRSGKPVTRKRSRSVNLARMRKARPNFALKPMAVAVAAAGLVGCGPSTREAQVYQTVEECVADHPSYSSQCRNAYNKALRASREQGRKYATMEDCEEDFGFDQCESRGSLFNPLMAAFLFSPYYNRGYYPLYTSTSYSSPYYGTWTTNHGERYPKQAGSNKVVLTKKTISRGGFGSTTAAKSKWGGSSGRGGWGG